MVLASIYFAADAAVMAKVMAYPLVIAGACIITSVIGTFFVRLGKSQNIMGALYKGLIVTGVLSAIVLWPITDHMIGMNTTLTAGTATFTGVSLFWCGIVGLLVTAAIVWATEYYTGTEYRPVKRVAQDSTTGHGTNVKIGRAHV